MEGGGIGHRSDLVELTPRMCFLRKKGPHLFPFLIQSEARNCGNTGLSNELELRGGEEGTETACPLPCPPHHSGLREGVGSSCLLRMGRVKLWARLAWMQNPAMCLLTGTLP